MTKRKGRDHRENAPVVDVVATDETITAPVVDVVDTAIAPVDVVDVTDYIDVSHVDVVTDEPSTDVAVIVPTMVEIIASVEKSRTDAHWSVHRETRAGIPIPKGYGLCARAWYLFDDCFAKGVIDTASIVTIGAGAPYLLNPGNLRTEISRYRKYHGIARAGTARLVTVAPVTITGDAPVAPATDTTE